MNIVPNQRGFNVGNFKDAEGNECYLKESCFSGGPFIRIGTKELGLQHFVAGVGFTEIDTTFRMDDHWVANNSILLTPEMVKNLLPALTKFAETGEL
jgi:hypothetical protein